MSELDDRTEAKLLELLSYAPNYYQRSELYQSLMAASADEAVRLQDALADVFNQFFVETATWGLGYFEAELGIITNESLSVQARRAVVLQKMRGTGTLTAEKLAAILTAYGPRTAIIEQDPAHYRFDAVLVDFLLSPTRPVEDVGENIRDSIASVRPAHLGFLVNYREFVADAYREWYKQQYGKNFSQSDEFQGIKQTQSNYEMQFGKQDKGMFRLNISLLGHAWLGPGVSMVDTSHAVFERQQDQERFAVIDNRTVAFRTNLSAVNVAPTLSIPVPVKRNMLQTVNKSEKTVAFADQHLGFDATVTTEELGFRITPDSFRFGHSTLFAPFANERTQGSSLLVQTQVNQESHVQQGNEHLAFRLNLSCLNAAPLLQIPFPSDETWEMTNTRAEQVTAFAELRQGFELTSLNVELDYRFDASSFRFGRTPLNSLLTAERTAEHAAMEQVHTASENVQDGNRSIAFRSNESAVNTAPLLSVPYGHQDAWEVTWHGNEQVVPFEDAIEGYLSTASEYELNFRFNTDSFATGASEIGSVLTNERTGEEDHAEFTQGTGETSLLQGNEERAFRFNQRPINFAPMLHVSHPHAASSIGTLTAPECAGEVLEQRAAWEWINSANDLSYAVDETDSFRFGRTPLNTLLFNQRTGDFLMSAVLYQIGADGAERTVEQRAL